MLDWSEARLSETLLHELAHATLWVPGHADFNESYANFVGGQAALRWLQTRHGAQSAEAQDFMHGLEDATRYRALLDAVVTELDQIYALDIPEADRRQRKAAIFASLVARARGAGFHDEARFVRRFEDASRWNNARLLQYRTYNRGQKAFAVLLDEAEGDLPTFLSRIDALMQHHNDPWQALGEASGISTTDDAFHQR